MVFPRGANTAVRGLQGQEYEVSVAFGDSDHLAAALVNNGFLLLPTAAQYVNPANPAPTVNYTDATGTTHYGVAEWSGTYAPDHPEYDSSNLNAKFLATGPGRDRGRLRTWMRRPSACWSSPRTVRRRRPGAERRVVAFANAHFAAAGFSSAASAATEASAYYAPNLTIAGVAYPVHRRAPAGPDPVWASLPGGTLDTQVTDSASVTHDFFHGFYY